MNLHRRFAFIINFLYFGLILLIAYAALKYALPMVMPFVIGFVIAYFLRRPTLFLAKKLPISQRILALLMVLLFFSTVGLLITLGSLRILTVLKAIITNIPSLYHLHIEPGLRNLFSAIEAWGQTLDPALESTLSDLSTRTILSLGDSVSSLSVTAMGVISGGAASLPSFFIKVLLLVISSFFIALDYDQLTGFCMRQLGGRSKDLVLQIKEYVVGTLFVCIRSYALIMSITFVELSIGLSILGIRSSILIAFCIAVFDILPVLGTGGIMLPWVVISAFQGNFARALGLLIVYVIITIIRNIIEPRIVGSQLGLHPVVTLVSMFVGAQLFGVLGLFGFPITLSLLRYLNENGTVRLFK